jgi:hypothetical protein
MCHRCGAAGLDPKTGTVQPVQLEFLTPPTESIPSFFHPFSGAEAFFC